MAENPKESLIRLGQLVSLGNSSLDEAQIVFLPEIHDNETSLLAQLLLLAHEQKTRGKPIAVLDESLLALKKSGWELFSQKTMEILAARSSRINKESYSPKVFEKKLSLISEKLQNSPGQLEHLRQNGLWAISMFSNMASPFYGWDDLSKRSLTKRNKQMVTSIDSFLRSNNKVYVMVGARHVPDLEFLSSKQVMCNPGRFDSLAAYFSYVKNNFGPNPELKMGIGSTLPIFEYVKNKKYTVIFLESFYKDLHNIIGGYTKDNRGRSCIKI